jgi:Undecaprenyl-phosphate glucose phosphotransferase
MLNRHGEVFRTLLGVGDLALVAASWLAAYGLRFHLGFDAPLGVPEFRAYVMLLLFILPLWFVLFRSHGLYEAQRTSSLWREVSQVVAATAMGVGVLVVATFFFRSYFYSRAVVLLFFALSVVSVSSVRLALRGVLRMLRRRGHNLRYALVVGGGELAGQVIERIHAHREAGLRVVGVLSDDPGRPGRSIVGVPVLAGTEQIKQVLQRHTVQQVLIALPKEDAHRLEKILADLDDETVSIRLVPDLLHVLTLRSSVEDLDGLPMINLRESPLVGWAAVGKRALDIAVSGFALLVAAPLLGAIALCIRMSTGRPILYAQERMGLDGRVFRMMKFRTMVSDAEAESGPVWTVPDDPRRTGLGAFLRRTSLDELPQLWNVLRGDMSLVGPRPERPVFIEQFRREIPGYMLRHKVKAGLTGWAQVHGWRGNTSLHERVEHDIYYIQNWSLGLDLQILLMTLWQGLVHRNAY